MQHEAESRGAGTGFRLVLIPEIFDAVIKFVFDLTAAVLLGLTFLFQSLSVVIAFDQVVVSFYQVLCLHACTLFCPLVLFTPVERERRATVAAVVRFLGNVAWVSLVYSVDSQTFTHISWTPLLAILAVQASTCFLASRLETEKDILTQGCFCVTLCALLCMVTGTLMRTPEAHLIRTVFLLRSPFDTLCQCLDTVSNLCSVSHESAPFETSLLIAQISQHTFWSVLHLLHSLYGFNRSGSRGLFFGLFVHEFTALAVPVRLLMAHLTEQSFPRLTAAEAAALDEPCAVCLSEHNTTTVRLRCSHVLHSSCLNRILQQSSLTGAQGRCPMCRANIEADPPTSPPPTHTPHTPQPTPIHTHPAPPAPT
mmetsp:Transcript_24783/g.56028  ORF Transcript_24783/g.56028 Transcript_24783/m.56028 type:complete len:367 (+) Transcript_24783:231-1331(+)